MGKKRNRIVRRDPIRRHNAKVAGWIAAGVVGLLAGSLVLHYLAVLLLYYVGVPEGAAALGETLEHWLPGIIALASGVICYYFGNSSSSASS
jgi:hypothetical protein